MFSSTSQSQLTSGQLDLKWVVPWNPVNNRERKHQPNWDWHKICRRLWAHGIIRNIEYKRKLAVGIGIRASPSSIMSGGGDIGFLHFLTGKKAIIKAGFKDTICYCNVPTYVFDKPKHFCKPNSFIIRIVYNAFSCKQKLIYHIVQLGISIQFSCQGFKQSILLCYQKTDRFQKTGLRSCSSLIGISFASCNSFIQ